MKIGLVQIDGKLPNHALMQISTFHERLGDDVEWFKGELYADSYDEIYASKIFSFSRLPQIPKRAQLGGTGIDYKNRLPEGIEKMPPSYLLYPDCNFHIGFSMKGCRFACKFCCVPKKEGRPVHHSSIDELLINPKGKDRLMLLDNDFFGVKEKWRENLERIIKLDLQVCFVQGLNIRIITDEQAELLAQCKYRNPKFSVKSQYLTFAWDQFRDGTRIFDGIDRCERAGIPAHRMQFFVLIGFDSTHEQNLERVTRLRDRGSNPFVMPFNKFDPYQQKFARWVNHRAIFNSVSWDEYNSSIKKTYEQKETLPLA